MLHIKIFKYGQAFGCGILTFGRSVGETNEKEAADRASKEGQGSCDSKAKKVWREHENRWSHDRYNEDDQRPKSREELIAVYGYDIRNEEGPPRARRRRRYG
jgi:protein CASC3